MREDDYRHPTAKSLSRPDVGTQAQFRKRKPPVTYCYDSSLSPALDWDNNPAREQGEAAIREILEVDAGAIDSAASIDAAKNAARDALAKTKRAAEKLKRLGAPFLNWTGKAERLSFDVPTLPLFVHERLSTKAIIETLTAHERKPEPEMLDLFGDPNRSITDQVLHAYEHPDKWANRLILGDSLIVMNSLLNYEKMGGQVQMIYIDPPYGVKFGSNFQPFVRKRDVSHNDDDDMTREPEMVKAYRDTWELGLHSYLAYLRDRLLLARDLLHPSGSVFVQISDENVHHVRSLLDEIFEPENFCAQITFKKTTGAGSPAIGTDVVPAVSDYLLWYGRDRAATKYRQLYESRVGEGWVNYDYVKLANGTHRRMTLPERDDWSLLPEGAVVYRRDNLTSTSSVGQASEPFEFEGHNYTPGRGGWKTSRHGLSRLVAAKRVEAYGNTLAYRRYATDFPYSRLPNLWEDTVTGGYAEQRFYVVQTNSKVLRRCILMTTDPGDLVLDPTCGSGTTAYVAEQWGRRWITIDTSRVPLALARQRLLTATFPFYELQQRARGPAGGFVYKRKQKKGQEDGGIVPHVTLKSIANNEPPQEEVLVDRPEEVNNIVRVTGPFAVEATIPSPVDLETGAQDQDGSARDDHSAYLERMLEVLRKSPVLHVGGARTIKLNQILIPVKALALSAEATVDGANGKNLQAAVDAAHEVNSGGLKFSQQPVAILFGPENAAVSERLVNEAAREARAKGFTHLYVMGFAIEPVARNLIENCEAVSGVPATYVQATPDLAIGDLLKTTRSSQIFSVCGMPEIRLEKVKPAKSGDAQRYRVELLGLDVFDPATMELEHRRGDDLPAWLLDTNYNGLVFHGSQVFFPRTGAWNALKKALRATHEESVWDHLAGTTSAEFEAGEHRQIAAKVIDDRGNELLVVKNLKEAV